MADKNQKKDRVTVTSPVVAKSSKNIVRVPQQLGSYFDQVWVINLKRRPERLARFWNEISKSRWPFRRPEVFSAIEGDKVGVPKFWQTGGGSYGCLRSHLVLLERAIQDDIGSILVLEDDAVFMNTFGQEVADFLTKVPDDWQCLMLGGQHVNSTPFRVLRGVVRAGPGGGIQRTHCYALRGREIKRALYFTWTNTVVHCDWVMGPCTAKFNTYAPEPFLVGQGDGESDISGRQNPSKFWRSPKGTEPVVVLKAPRMVMEGLRKKGWHAGFILDQSTGIDQGLAEIFNDKSLDLSQRSLRLRDWIVMIQGEAASMLEPAICTVWHSAVDAEMVRPLIKGKVIEIIANTIDEALNQLSTDIHTHEPVLMTVNKNVRVVLLRASRVVMEILREEGWHIGHWRDPVTGQDNGIRNLFASTMDKADRIAGLRDVINTLHEEVRQMPNGVLTLWHDEITPDMVVDTDIQVVEIVAANAAQAKTKLKEMSNGQRTQV